MFLLEQPPATAAVFVCGAALRKPEAAAVHSAAVFILILGMPIRSFAEAAD
jgi:hypothetical protein